MKRISLYDVVKWYKKNVGHLPKKTACFIDGMSIGLQIANESYKEGLGENIDFMVKQLTEIGVKMPSIVEDDEDEQNGYPSCFGQKVW